MANKITYTPQDWKDLEILFDGPEDDPAVAGDAGEPRIRVRNKDRSVLVTLSPEELGYLSFKNKPLGTWKLSLRIGAQRAGKVALHGLGWTLGTLGAAAMAGIHDPVKLAGALAIAAGGAITSLGAEKVAKTKLQADGRPFNWKTVLLLLWEVLNIIIEKTRKKKEGEQWTKN